MSDRKRGRRKKVVGKRSAATRTVRGGKSESGLKSFAMHAYNRADAPMLTKLEAERTSHPAFATVTGAATKQVDPETAARRYLQQALDSKSVPSLNAPKSEGMETEFKSLGTETVPLTGTRTVKFRQTLNKIPIYGSLVTVELDDQNNLISVNSSLGEPKGISPIAKIAPADAVSSVKKYPGFRKQLENITPSLNYYFDQLTLKWRLVFILEDVTVAPDKKGVRVAPRYMDYIVDAHNGKVVAELPRTPSMASTTETATDGLSKPRQITIETNANKKLLKDTTLNIQTFDFQFKDPTTEEDRLPGTSIKNPPSWPPAAVSAHANAAAVAEFLRTVLRRNNIDNNGGPMNSSINCVEIDESEDGKQWLNAFWNGNQMVYGQRRNGDDMMSMAVRLDVVGHEMFHGVTDSTARLEYADQSGALNESYSDVFGIMIANFPNSDPRNWNWIVGEGLSADGDAFRDMSNPERLNQPAHMRDFRVLPRTRPGDYGGVHINSGIHNTAAFNILTAEDEAGGLACTPQEIAAVFYLTLTQQLSRTSQFSDSRRGAMISARTLYRNLSAEKQSSKLSAIENGFAAVGIR